VAVLGFPNPVNEVSARLVAAGVVTMAAATIAFDLRWMTLVLAYGFVARTLAGPTLSPLGQLVTRVITPALAIEPRLVPGPPKRFAQAIGAVFTVAAALLTFGVDRFDLAQVVLAILLVPATLEAFVGFCVGCQVFGVLMRAGLVPDEVCAACNDIWSRQPQRA
jgi:ABC-type multidrug transport system fused ATPase/permease subunit